jgi:hypothetical protein
MILVLCSPLPDLFEIGTRRRRRRRWQKDGPPFWYSRMYCEMSEAIISVGYADPMISVYIRLIPVPKY